MRTTETLMTFVQGVPRDVTVQSTRDEGMRSHVATVSVPHAPSLWTDWVATSVPFAVALLLALVLVRRRQEHDAPERAVARRAQIGSRWSRTSIFVRRVPSSGWALLSGAMAALLTLTAMLDAVDYSSVEYLMQWLLLPGIIISSLHDSWVEHNPMTVLKLGTATVVNFAFWALLAWEVAAAMKGKTNA